MPIGQDNYEQCFKSWFEKQKKKTGGPYKASTINSYIYRLKTAAAKIKTIKIENTNLFYCTTYESFSEVYNMIRSDPEFDKINDEAGHSTFSNAMEKYMEFLREIDSEENETLQSSLSNDVLSDDVQHRAPIVNTYSSKSYTYNLDDAWPKWEIPDQTALLKMAKLVTPYVRFLRPRIIKAIVDDNEVNRSNWTLRLTQAGVEPEYYLWENCSCVFPAIRRHSGNDEIAYFRKQPSKRDLKIEDALKIDDNSYPKQIWSFILRGKKFQNFGPQAYSLAHLADHKDYKNRKEEEFDLTEEAPEKVYGLYTCASNSVYLPNNLIEPTDFNREIRLLLMHKAQDLYGDVCNLFPPSFKLKKTSSLWDIDNFDWAEPVGNIDFMPTFLEYRREVMRELLKL